ncbi:MAG TPA: serine/threonine-protein kinase [Bryobacteraceae bacterium]|nr:serine/threonine-protein kinase [Bryobacteraceae bacterium]
MSRFLNEVVGDYRLIEFVGAGGMGEVYRALHQPTGRLVAVKVLTDGTLDPNTVTRFRNEARIQASLNHPGVASLIEFHEWNGRPTIVMEFVDGETLSEAVASRGHLSVHRAVAITRALARTLDYVHAKGIIHRDLKCGNVKITSGGQVKLLDFGIARDHAASHLTRTGFFVGTFESLAPEQIEGKDASVASDIWAMGIILYEALAGRGPFDGVGVPEIFARIVMADHTPASKLNPEVPPDLDRIIAKCLRKRPAERYQSMMELEQDLARINAKSSSQTAVPAPKIKPLYVGLLAFVAVIVILAVWIVPRQNGSEGKTTKPAPVTGQTNKVVTVDVVGGRASVYKDAKLLGTTPYAASGRPGETIDLILRRDGYRDLPVEFDVGERNYYSYTMDPVKH